MYVEWTAESESERDTAEQNTTHGRREEGSREREYKIKMILN